MFAGRLFHSLGAATEYGVPAERSPLYRGTTSLSGASIGWDRVRLVIVCFTSRSERYPSVPVRRVLHVTINILWSASVVQWLAFQPLDQRSSVRILDGPKEYFSEQKTNRQALCLGGHTKVWAPGATIARKNTSCMINK